MKKEERILKIQVPENLDFEGKFDEILSKYLITYELEEVKTANMGSLYKLRYRVLLSKGTSVKEMVDELRTKNGNLEIALQRPLSQSDEL